MWAPRKGHTGIVKMLLDQPGINVNLQNKVKLNFMEVMFPSHISIKINEVRIWNCYCVIGWKFVSYFGILGRTHRNSEDAARSPWYRYEFANGGKIVFNGAHVYHLHISITHNTMALYVLQVCRTALVYAASSGHTDTVEMLLSHPGIDTNQQNKVALYFLISWCPLVNHF